MHEKKRIMVSTSKAYKKNSFPCAPRLFKPTRAPPHNLTLTYQLSVELGAVEREVDVEVNAVEGSLGRVHALEVLFEIFA